MNWFTWYKEDIDWIVPEGHYNKGFKNLWQPIDNGQFWLQNLKEKRKIEETYTKYLVSAKFNGIPREGNTEIPIKSNKDQCREHISRNGMWDILSLPDPYNKGKKWDILLHQSIIPLDYVKGHVQSLQKFSETDQYVFQKLDVNTIIPEE